MAHSASVTALATDLLTTFAAPSSSARGFRRTRDAVLRGLRAHQWQRVNQFDVHASYDGLVEKFVVLDRDDLAEALDARLKELSKRPSRWTPELLSLFLALSDRPAEKSRLEHLENLKPPEPSPPLTWAEIIADDPLDEEDVWDDIDYAAYSSEEEPVPKQRKQAATRDATPASSVDEDDFASAAEAFVVPPELDVLSEISKSQFWYKQPGRNGSDTKQRVPITELQAVRETLFMLAGSSTSLFISNKGLKWVACSDEYALSHVMVPTWMSQLQEFAIVGTGLLQLRSWTHIRQSVALLQTFQAAVVQEVRHLDGHLAQLQACYLESSPAVPVSLIEVMANVIPKTQPLLRLKTLISNASQIVERSPFILLEAVYNEINMAQMCGESELFQFLARIFFQCLQTYLKPIRTWMEHGELGADDQMFFVGTADKSGEAASLWHDQYVLRRDATGKLHAPSFLHPAATKIFNSGKSVIFLKELGQDEITTPTTDAEPRLDLETVCSVGVDLPSAPFPMPLAPFSDLFDMAFTDWTRSKYTLASSILRERLFSRCGLWQSLDALEYIYFSKDGSLLQAFADTIFEKLDRGRRGWNDRYLLTEIARSIFGTVPCVHADKLAVRALAVKEKGRSVKALASVSVDYILPWPVMNVIQRSATSVYQRVFVLLIQVYRARYVLRTTQLWRTATTDSTHASANKNTHHHSSRHLQYYLRHRLLWFTDILHSYLTETVIASATAALRKDMADAEDIDVMAALHAEHVARLEARCLLEKKLAPIHQAVVSLLDLCVLYADTVAAQQERDERSGSHLSPPAGTAAARRESGGTYRRRPRDANRRSSSLRVAIAESESESDESGPEAEADADVQRGKGGSAESFGPMRERFEQLHGFVAAGLRGVSRAGAGDRCWEMLAERLEWEGQGQRG